MHQILAIALIVYCVLGILVVLVALVSRKSDVLCHVPGLDFVVGIFTFVPWVVAFYIYGLAGFLGALAGQLVFLYSFSFVHAKLKNYNGPTIKNTLNRIVGPFSNHLGLLISLLALPGFWVIRFSQIIIYPMLVWTLRFPRYKESEWINVSRHKFSGLVGHDLVWCLYCDWMTGIYSLGGEMLRNVESFWCPIAFYHGKKCENCKNEFPDISKWVKADGSMDEVASLLLEKYPPESEEPRIWYGARTLE